MNELLVGFTSEDKRKLRHLIKKIEYLSEIKSSSSKEAEILFENSTQKKFRR